MERSAGIPKHQEHGFAFGDAYVRVTVSGTHDGTSLYFLHGRFSDSAIWSPLMPELTAYRRICVDFPGFGWSFSMGRRSFGLAEYIRLVAKVLERFPPSPFSAMQGAVLVGHDIGGAVASLLAVRAPEKVSGIVLLNSASPCEPLASRIGWRGWRAQWSVRREFRRSGMANLPELWSKGASRGALVHILRDIERTWPGPEERRFWRHSLKKHDPAALILWGGRDSIQPVEKGVSLARILTRSDFYVDPGVGHWPSVDSAAWVAARVREFVFRLEEERSISGRRFLSR